MKRVLLCVFALLFLVSCVPNYENYYVLDPEYMARRQAETKRFETDNEKAMLTAASQVLQDLGFTLEESETKLGLITASKKRGAGLVGQTGLAGQAIATALPIAMVLLKLNGREAPVVDVDQKIYTTLVTTKSRQSKGYNVRITFATRIRNNKNDTRVVTIRDPEIYKDFFDKLSQSLFLTANDL